MYLFLADRNRLLTPERLDELLDLEGADLRIPPVGKNHAFLLPPIEERPDLVALLTVDWKCGRKVNRGSFRLWMLREVGDEVDGVSVVPPVTPFVIRFDDCEEHSGRQFSHAQITERLPDYDGWMHRGEMGEQFYPSEFPRVPLASLRRNGGALLLCVIASLYGSQSRTFVRVGTTLAGNSDAEAILRHLEDPEELRADEG